MENRFKEFENISHLHEVFDSRTQNEFQNGELPYQMELLQNKFLSFVEIRLKFFVNT